MSSFDKQKNIIDFTLASLFRRRAKNISLVVVYTLVIFLLASVMFFTHAIKHESALVLREAPEMMVQRLIAGRHDLIPVSYGEVIAKIRGVQGVKPRFWGYYYNATNGANYTVMVDPEMARVPGEIIVGRGVAETLPEGSHATIPFKTHDGEYVFLKVKAVMPSESSLVAADLVVMAEPDFMRVFGYPEGFATDLVLDVRNRKELATIAGKITQLLPDTRPILRDEILRTYDAVFDWRGGIVVVVLFGALLSFIVFAWDKATGLSAEERREIGILKALGWETSDVLLMKFWEGVAVSLTSFCMGVFLAYMHVFLASSTFFEPVLKGWSVLYPDFKLTPFVSPFEIATLFFLTVVPYTVTTIVPSWRAATIDPDSIMRT